MTTQLSTVAAVREFNRYYTGVIGLLNQHILDSDLSLSEVRVLYEIGERTDCTAGQLTTVLGIDGGYLSRVLKAFEKKGWITRKRCADDGRTWHLLLSDKGRELISLLNDRSNTQISNLLQPLPPASQQAVANAMKNIRDILSADNTSAPNTSQITFRHELLPGDVGYLIYLHGHLYARDTGYNLEFEQYVCGTFQDFLRTYNPSKDRVFMAIHEAHIIGAVAILGHSKTTAQLRWFLLDPAFRGLGLGKKLLQDALSFCKEKKYEKVYLLTTSLQTTAIELYKKAGFRKTGEKHLHQWGKELFEERYDMDLSY
ncbi:bifunctional helix-turn-helix transcriptional regulator/GNAT family N-acetyltransferase [Chitinophaga pendula]|uniref:bifunctional helix-turn-helix transcriptional regulator/GNAT family N-acetyltransferase n=1 Tax=Chitinophaga TaxID=79328 RepID=UPI000BB06824|nr:MULTISPECIES: bifunctional helix-turn-helix transcriptional regulator/GNAT family N-acetyltransferase [Chitinophaga]ASZ13216.1 hypothetical protein CK934_20750 [Chitinophaga sp. MD30]UCJ09164.1 bifunctional helix-turn-helix transcriptional regulator/GNAT family N-acetyltransferase [Chitinophaga pendula]